MTKSCTKCNEIKNLTDFQKDSTKLDGRHTRCKICKNESKKLNKKSYEPTIYFRV